MLTGYWLESEYWANPTDSANNGHLEWTEYTNISDSDLWMRRGLRDFVCPFWQPQTIDLLFDTITSWDTGGARSHSSNGSTC